MTYPFVSEYSDRHGKRRYRFRRAGFSAHLPAPDAEQFAAEYERLLATAPPTPIRSPKSPVGQLRTTLRRHGWSDKGEFVYFIQSRGMVKIGFSSKIANRITELSAQNPVTVRLLAVIQGGRDMERRLHEMLAEHRIKGEWFRRSDQVKAVVAEAKKGRTFANIV